MESNIQKNKIFGLDVFRTFAILFVLFSHLYIVLNINHPTVYVFSGMFGFLGVEMFFVLSGFLIGSILVKDLQKPNYNRKHILNFWKRRWFRTLPAYYFILFLNLFLAIILKFELNNFWMYPFFIQNAFSNSITFFTESWSLSVEEWSYFILPILIYLVNKFIVQNIKYCFFVATLVVIVFAHIVRYIHNDTVVYEDMNIWNDGLKSVVLFRIDAIAYGFIVAWFYYFYRSILYKYSIYLLIIALHLFFLQFFVFNVLGINIVNNPVYFNVFYVALIGVTIMLSLPIFIFWDKPILGGNFFTFISKISYSVYLVHYSICAVIIKYFFSSYFDVFSNGFKIFIYLLFVLLTSLFVYHFIERPFLKIREKYTNS